MQWIFTETGRPGQAWARAEGESALNLLRIALWFVASGVFWLAGALVSGEPLRLSPAD